MMTLRGLKKEVKKLAKGEYHSVKEEITEYHTGEVEKGYQAYIHRLDYTEKCKTPEGALDELRTLIKEKGGE